MKRGHRACVAGCSRPRSSACTPPKTVSECRCRTATPLQLQHHEPAVVLQRPDGRHRAVALQDRLWLQHGGLSFAGAGPGHHRLPAGLLQGHRLQHGNLPAVPDGHVDEHGARGRGQERLQCVPPWLWRGRRPGQPPLRRVHLGLLEQRLQVGRSGVRGVPEVCQLHRQDGVHGGERAESAPH